MLCFLARKVTEETRYIAENYLKRQFQMFLFVKTLKYCSQNEHVSCFVALCLKKAGALNVASAQRLQRHRTNMGVNWLENWSLKPEFSLYFVIYCLELNTDANAFFVVGFCICSCTIVS